VWDERRVAGSADLTHAGPEGREDLVRAEAGAGEQSQRCCRDYMREDRPQRSNYQRTRLGDVTLPGVQLSSWRTRQGKNPRPIVRKMRLPKVAPFLAVIASDWAFLDESYTPIPFASHAEWRRPRQSRQRQGRLMPAREPSDAGSSARVPCDNKEGMVRDLSRDVGPSVRAAPREQRKRMCAARRREASAASPSRPRLPRG
jgi:hypothetical protein